MYDGIAPYYDRLYARLKDYPAEARALAARIRAMAPEARTLLDVGCGSGAHVGLLHAQFGFEVEGVDISHGLLGVARANYPSIPFHQGDLAEFQLDRQFDVVTCLFGSIGYVGTSDRLEAGCRQLAAHVRAGGLLLLEPWLKPESYREGNISHNVVDEPDFKASWMHVAQRRGNLSVFDIHYLIGTSQGVQHYTEHQELALFDSTQYVAALERAGLQVLEHDPHGLHGYGLFVCRR